MSEEEKQPKTRGIDIEESSSDLKIFGKHYFFGIGIDAYENFESLNNAVKDVKDISTLLKEKYQFAESEMILLLNEEANEKNILNQLEELVKKVDEDDTLLIYYSGHGHLNPETNRGFWIPVDAELDNTADYIRNSTLKDYIQDIKAFHTFLISDSCFSGSLLREGKLRSGEAESALENMKSRWAFCSGRPNEKVFDGKPGENSPFASSIIKVLNENNGTKLNAGKFVDEVRKETAKIHDQVPIGNPMDQVDDDGGQFIFHLRVDEGRDWALAQKKNNLEGFETYLERYPNGKYVNEARKSVGALKEDAIWNLVLEREEPIVALLPKMEETIMAQKAEKEEEEINEQAQILQDYEEALKDYIFKYPEGKYKEDAIRKNKIFNDEKVWFNALRIGELYAFQDYLNKFPEGRHADRVVEKINELAPKGTENKIVLKLAEKEDAIARIKRNLPWIIGGVFVGIIGVFVMWWWDDGKISLERKIAFDELKPFEGDNYIGLKVNGKWGYYDNSTSASVIPSIYDQIFPFNEDVALVQKEQKFGWIDRKGETVIPFSFNWATPFPDDKDETRVTRGKDTFTIDRKGLCIANCPMSKDEEENEAWKAALEANTIGNYEIYLKQFPDGSQIAVANRKIEELKNKEEDIWKEAKQLGTYKAYLTYLTAYPNGRYQEQIKEELALFFMDSRDSQYYRQLIVEDMVWMAENLKFDPPSKTYCYDNKSENCASLGRLYTWQQANIVCPSGWHLPDDNEWFALAKHFGGAFSRSKGNAEPDAGKKAFELLIPGGPSGFNSILAGVKSDANTYQYLGEMTAYWTSLRSGDQRAVIYALEKSKGQLVRTDQNRSIGLSCRCVKDRDKTKKIKQEE